MSIKWLSQTVDLINIKCPYCKHQAGPPVYPYCKHTVFVYNDPSVDDPGFDFVSPGFAAAYLSRLKTTNLISQEELDISLEAEHAFLNDPFNKQKIKLYTKLISDELFSSDAIVFEFFERRGLYPTRVVVAFQVITEQQPVNPGIKARRR